MRTMLFAAGSNAVHCKKAIESPADAVIMDLEDAVEVGAKAGARETIAAVLDGNNSGARTIVVRINGMTTEYAYEDILAVVRPGLYAVMLPKTDSERDLSTLDWMLTQAERHAGLPVGSVSVVPIIETAAGFGELRQIARASDRVPFLSFGAGDYSLDIGATNVTSNPALVWAKVQLVNESRTAGLRAPIDSVYADVSNTEELRVQARLAREIGYQGKACIHPTQIDVIHAEFAPSAAEIAQAHRIVAAFDEATARGVAAILIDSRLVDYPVAEQARRLIESA